MKDFAQEVMEVGLKLAKNGGLNNPIFVLESRTGKRLKVGLTYKLEDKAVVREAMRETIKKVNPARVAVVAEAWVGSVNGAKEVTAPSQDPNRRAAVQVSAVSSTKDKCSLLQFFQRNGDNELISEGAVEEREEAFNRWLDGIF